MTKTALIVTSLVDSPEQSIETQEVRPLARALAYTLPLLRQQKR